MQHLTSSSLKGLRPLKHPHVASLRKLPPNAWHVRRAFFVQQAVLTPRAPRCPRGGDWGRPPDPRPSRVDISVLVRVHSLDLCQHFWPFLLVPVQLMDLYGHFPHISRRPFHHRLWRRSHLSLAQVCFYLRDLRRESLFYALQWRRSPPFFHTCAKTPQHLRQNTPTPAPQFLGFPPNPIATARPHRQKKRE